MLNIDPPGFTFRIAMPAPTLHQLSIQCCCRNVRAIRDVGEAPFRLVEPILMKIDNALQLKELEENSPQLRGEDRAVWQALLRRDVPGSEDYEPKNPLNWAGLYYKLRKQHEKEVQQSSQALAQSLSKIRQEKAKSQMTFSNKLQARGRKRTSHASGANSRDTTQMRGRSILEKARKEAKDAKTIIHRGAKRPAEGSARAMLATPNTAAGQPRVSDQRKPPAPLSSKAAEVLRTRRDAEHPSKRLAMPQSRGPGKSIEEPTQALKPITSSAPPPIRQPTSDTPPKRRPQQPSIFMPMRRRP